MVLSGLCDPLMAPFDDLTFILHSAPNTSPGETLSCLIISERGWMQDGHVSESLGRAQGRVIGLW